MVTPWENVPRLQTACYAIRARSECSHCYTGFILAVRLDQVFLVYLHRRIADQDIKLSKVGSTNGTCFHYLHLHRSPPEAHDTHQCSSSSLSHSFSATQKLHISDGGDRVSGHRDLRAPPLRACLCHHNLLTQHPDQTPCHDHKIRLFRGRNAAACGYGGFKVRRPFVIAYTPANEDCRTFGWTPVHGISATLNLRGLVDR